MSSLIKDGAVLTALAFGILYILGISYDIGYFGYFNVRVTALNLSSALVGWTAIPVIIIAALAISVLIYVLAVGFAIGTKSYKVQAMVARWFASDDLNLSTKSGQAFWIAMSCFFLACLLVILPSIAASVGRDGARSYASSTARRVHLLWRGSNTALSHEVDEANQNGRLLPIYQDKDLIIVAPKPLGFRNPISIPSVTILRSDLLSVENFDLAH